MEKRNKLAFGVFVALVLLTIGGIVLLLTADKKMPKNVEVHSEGDREVMDGFAVETEFMLHHRIYSTEYTDSYDVVVGKRIQRVTFSDGTVTATEEFDKEDEDTKEPYTSHDPNYSYYENTGTEYVFCVDGKTEYQYKKDALLENFRCKSVFAVPEEAVIVLFGTQDGDAVAFLYVVETATMKKTVLWERVGTIDDWGCSIDGGQLAVRMDAGEKSRLAVFHVKQPEQMLYAYEISAWDVIGRYDGTKAISEHGTVSHDADVYVEGDRVYIAELNRYLKENSVSYRVYVGERGTTLYQGEVCLADNVLSQKTPSDSEYELKAEHGRIRIVPKQ